jgi:CRISPR-associated protein Csb2
VIVAPLAWPAAAYTLFVPNNDADKKFERQNRLTKKPVRPQRMLSAVPEATLAQALHYTWGISEDEWAEARCHAELLCREAHQLTALGWGIDQAVAQGRILAGTEVEALTGRRWRPRDAPFAGRPRLRVPERGSLDDVGRAYDAFRNRLSMELPPKARDPRVFGTRVYLPLTELPPRSYAVFELPDRVSFRPESTAVVATMLRSLTCRCAKADTHEFPGGTEVYVAGHVKADEQTPPRFTYLPLPTIGHEHADGAVRRLLIAEPFGGDGAQASWAQQRLRNTTLQDENGNERGVLIDLWRPHSRRVVGRYVRQAQMWCSVTPVVLPGLDDGKQAKAERLFLKAVTQAEIPIEALESVTLRKAPFFPGAAHPRQYFVPEYLRSFARWHVAVRFREPVPGPLAIGAGRHVGLGLFAVADHYSP